MSAGLKLRLAKIEALVHPEEHWWEGEGLSALLEAAKRLPPCSRDLDPEEEREGSMAQLLREAKQWLKEKGGVL